VAEALSCSKPVLITNKINIYREIEKRGAGIISEDNLEGTILNIKNWLNLSKDDKQKMEQNANLVYETNFKIKNIAKILVNALNN